MNATSRRAAGFTLLELIVVIGIFAVLAVMAYGGLRTVLDARGRIDRSLEHTEALQKAFWIMRDDFINADQRAITDGDGQVVPAFIYVPLDHRVGFTRGGWPNPTDLPRSTLQRVGYLYNEDEHRLLRRTWPVLDRAPQTKPTDTPIVHGVSQARWRFLDSAGRWHEHWPAQAALTAQPGVQIPPPQAVELRFTVKGWGKIRWLFSYGVMGGSLPTQSPLAPPTGGFGIQPPSNQFNPGIRPLTPGG